MKKDERKKRRDRVKNPALKKRYNSRIKGEYLDYDYLDQLSDEELAWLNKFTEEELNAKFNKDGSDFNTSDEERKAIYNRNNQRNRCLYGRLRNNGRVKRNSEPVQLVDIENVTDEELGSVDLVEDAIIDYLDSLSGREELDNSNNGSSNGDQTD